MAAPGAPLERGYRLGKYEVIGRLSVGGMAELYLAFLAGQGGFKKFVALKRVLPSVAQQESFLKMFLDEARITASLSHANIAQVYELAEDPGNREPVLAMEFVAGQNLAQILRRARDRNIELPVGFACRIIHDALLGLHSAHHFVEPTSGKPMPVIHRDINPRNVMVTYAGGTKVIDFGIAKARGRLDSTQAGMMKGTIRYMSPEQVLLEPLDGRSDLFAASVVLYELLSGLRLFDEPTDVAVLSRIARCEIPPLLEVMPTLSPELADVLARGLARQPEGRWPTGREYARALDRAVPDLFDDVAVGELMGRLFEDRIAVTRALLQSTSTEASYANLELMRQGQDEPGSRPGQPALAPPPRPSLTDASTPPQVTDRPLAGGELPTVQDRPGAVASTASTLVIDEPVAAATAKELPGIPEEAVTDPVRPKAAAKAPGPAATVAEGITRRPSSGVPAQGGKRVAEGPALAKPLPQARSTAERQLLQPVAAPAQTEARPRGGWLLLVTVAALLVLAGLALLGGGRSSEPEQPQPVRTPGARPGP